MTLQLLARGIPFPCTRLQILMFHVGPQPKLLRKLLLGDSCSFVFHFKT